jgi:hypothetical protein
LVSKRRADCAPPLIADVRRHKAVADDKWFRNSTWDETSAARFEEKLRRARRKEQYLRIQACCLVSTFPTVALDLLERYFALPDQWDQAQANVDKACALVALDRLSEAVEAYEAALSREAAFPNLLTSAYVSMPTLVVEHELRSYYDRALAVLDSHSERPVFPAEHFQFHAARALILLAKGRTSEAKDQGRLALEAATKDHSGFRYHPKLGLVSSKHDRLLGRLKTSCDA